MNALDPAMFEGLSAALGALATDGSIRVIVLSGEGSAFCAGLDLGSFGLNDDAPSDLVPRTHGKANWVQQMGSTAGTRDFCGARCVFRRWASIDGRFGY